MTVTTGSLKSVERTAQGVSGSPTLDSSNTYGNVQFARFSYLQPAATDSGDGSTLELVQLPPGKITIIEGLSYIRFTAMHVGATYDIGCAAYTNTDGTAVSAIVDCIDDGVSGSTANRIYLGAKTVLETVDGTDFPPGTVTFSSRDGVTIVMTLLGATTSESIISAGARVDGVIAFVQD